MSPRIGIVGAGAGGLSLARLLTERGFADVTVIERADRVGGKSLTVFHEGVGHELGTCYLALGYGVVKRWMREAGIVEFPLKRQRILTAGHQLIDFKDFVCGNAGWPELVSQLVRYAADWARFYEWDVRGAPDATPGTRGRPMREEVAEPFAEWLAARQFDALARFAIRSMSVMGYGAPAVVPALYGLRWNKPSLLAAGVLARLSEPVPGWEALWSSMARNLDVRTGHVITAVQRTERCFMVQTDHGTCEFDHLVLTCALDEAATWFPFTAAERAAYGLGDDGVRWRDFYTTLVDVAGWFQDADTWCAEAAAKGDPATTGRLIGARRTGDKSAVAKARSTRRANLYVCYQYGDYQRTPEAALRILHEDLTAHGATVRSVIRQCRWKYAPQFGSDAIRAGALARFERQQGEGGLWISGATTCHEAVNNIVSYNSRLVERMATAFAGGDPSNEETLRNIAGHFRYSVVDK